MTDGLENTAAVPGIPTNRRFGQRLCALLALLIALLPGLMTAAVVWISLGRPLLFRQIRSGRHGRLFTLVKMRTMRDARADDGQFLPDSERQTRTTRLIRAARLDEIPQLLAIFAGDMNFVGPRPLQPSTIASFGRLGELRGTVAPGLTGWAQVNGNTHLSDEEKLALDIWYIDHRSAALDGRILLMTAQAVLSGERVNQKNLAAALHHLRTRSQHHADRGAPDIST
jgi:lipopolysaccharide/colanic/teichoic acid biosynthesis glycosyltransferase